MRLSTLTPFLILIFTVATHAAVKVALKTTKGVTVASNNPVDQTFVNKSISKRPKAKDDKEPKSDWAYAFLYKVSTNLASTGEKRRYTNGIGADVSYSITKKISASMGTALNWKAEGQNVRNEQDNPAWDDLSAGIGYGDKLTETMTWSVGASNSFPTGNDSRAEEIKGVLGASAGLSMTFFEKSLSWANTVSASKYFHTYELSIVSGESNVDTNFSYSTKIRYSFAGGFSTGVGASIWTTTQINGEKKTGLSSAASWSGGYTYKLVNVNVGYSFGNYERADGGYQLMLFDDTKKIVNLGVGIGF